MPLVRTNNYMAEKEFLSTIPFKIVEQNPKQLEINLIKNVKDLCDENYKTLKKQNTLKDGEMHHAYGLV